MDTTAVVLALACVANLFLGLFVLLRNPKARTGRSFLLMALFIDGYAITNYLTDNASTFQVSDTSNRLAYLLAYLALVSTVLFTRYFIGKEAWSKKYKFLELLFVLAIGIFSMTNYVAGEVTGVISDYTFSPGSLTIVYDLVLLFLLLLIIHDLFLFYKRGDINQKNQAKIIAAGFSASILIAMITNAVLPLLFSNYNFTKLGPPLLSLLLITSITYAIVRHQLFDIRPIVARSFAYILTLFSIAAAYSVIVFGIASSFFTTKAPLNQEIFYVAFTVVAALSFQPLSRLFNKFANKIFLRDYYSPQDVLDQLGDKLVGSVNLEEIEKESIRIIKTTLHSDFVHFLIPKDDVSSTQLLELLHHTHGDMVEFDNLYQTHHGKLYEVMKNQNVAIAVKLRTKREFLGYLSLGYKASGSPYSNGDKQLLGIAADEIAISLQNALRFEEIQQFNITLQEKVDQATKQLRHANTKLKELDKTKDEFISMASHQLRTPLTTIKGYLSMILEGDVGVVKKSQKEMIQQAFGSAENMVDLIADLLNISRLQSGKFVIDNKPTQLLDMVKNEVKRLEEQARTRNIKLSLSVPASLPVLALDETKIRQVVMNLIDNALYYTPAGGSVTVALEATDSTVSYTVTDTGVGVPKEMQHHLFSKFYRADNAKKMRPDGTGLGLFMAKKVIVAQGGAIIFKSTEGKGSTFGFSFPRSKTEVKK